MLNWTIGLVLLFGLFIVYQEVQSCNEAVCGSVVSKCLLTQSCKCELKNCTCCKDCFNCLNHFYSECCSCVDMCPKPNTTGGQLGKKSHVEELEPMSSLFDAITDSQIGGDKWRVYTYPVDIDLSQYQVKDEIKIQMQSAEQEVVSIKKKVYTMNCTVVFWNQCASWEKCKAHCSSMGAASYRWFHDSCCQCVGEHCINYGINESRCSDCPTRSEDHSTLEEDELDYGEDDDDMEDEDDDDNSTDFD